MILSQLMEMPRAPTDFVDRTSQASEGVTGDVVTSTGSSVMTLPPNKEKTERSLLFADEVVRSHERFPDDIATHGEDTDQFSASSRPLGIGSAPLSSPLYPTSFTLRQRLADWGAMASILSDDEVCLLGLCAFYLPPSIPYIVPLLILLPYPFLIIIAIWCAINSLISLTARYQSESQILLPHLLSSLGHHRNLHRPCHRFLPQQHSLHRLMQPRYLIFLPK